MSDAVTKLMRVVHMAKLVGNQSEHEKDNRAIVLEGHVTH